MTGRNKDNEPASTAPPASGDEDGIAEDLFSDGRRDELRRLLEMAARKRDEAARAAARGRA